MENDKFSLEDSSRFTVGELLDTTVAILMPIGVEINKKILVRYPDKRRLVIAEALLIKTERPALNSQDHRSSRVLKISPLKINYNCFQVEFVKSRVSFL